MTPDYILETRERNDQTGLRESIEADARRKETTDGVGPQPAPDADGECWEQRGRDVFALRPTMDRGRVVATRYRSVATAQHEDLAARIVSDHTQAAAVPKLVEALKALKKRAEFALATPSLIRGRDELKAAVESVDAALPSTQIQEKQ
jgi:hypothetical protein